MQSNIVIHLQQISVVPSKFLVGSFQPSALVFTKFTPPQASFSNLLLGISRSLDNSILSYG